MKTFREFIFEAYQKPEVKQIFDTKTRSYKQVKPGTFGYEFQSRAISDPAYKTYQQTGRMPYDAAGGGLRGIANVVRTLRPLKALPGGSLYSTGASPMAQNVVNIAKRVPHVAAAAVGLNAGRVADGTLDAARKRGDLK